MPTPQELQNAVYWPLVVERHATLTFAFQILNRDKTEVDLDGYTARSEFRPVADGVPGTPVIALTSETGGGLTIEDDGSVVLEATPDQTAALVAALEGGGEYIWDCFLYTGSRARRVIGGPVYVAETSTRPAEE